MPFSIFQISASGMKATQDKLSVISNNIANINTDGFKGSRYEFKEIFYRALPSSNSDKLGLNEMGQGVGHGGTLNDMDQGNLRETGNSKDMAIDGEGFFILDIGGNSKFTRGGQFRTTEFGGDIVLAASHSGYVLQGWNATFPSSALPPSIDTNQNPENLEIPLGTLERVRQTANVEVEGNLNGTGETSTIENTLSSIPLADINSGNAAVVGTDLQNLARSDTLSPDLLFDDLAGGPGAIRFSALKGSSRIEEVFIYGSDGTSLGDLMTWMGRSLGIDNPDTSDPTSPTGIALEGGILKFGTGFGPQNAVTDLKLVHEGLAGAQPVFDFIDVEKPGNGTSGLAGISVIDPEGNSHQVDIQFTKTSYDDTGTTWKFALESSSNFKTGNSLQFQTGTIRFGLQGELLESTPATATLNFVNESGGNDTMDFNLDFSLLTQLSSTENFQLNSSHDGFEKGTLIDYQMSDGIILGIYDSGLVEEIGKVAIATFQNPENLNREEYGYFDNFNAIMPATIQEARAGKAGAIRSGFSEESNVDLTHQFGQLIIAQRGFQAASNGLKVAIDLLQKLANLQR